MKQLKDKIKLWDRVVINITKDGKTNSFLSRVENIKKKSIVLEQPIKQSGDANLSKGDIVEVSYNKYDAAYTFKASIQDLFVGGANSLELAKIGDMKRKQRRQYVRLDFSGKINFRVLDAQNKENETIGSEIKGELLNISAGGFLFETDFEITNNSLILLNMELKNKYKLENIIAFVKRAEKSTDLKYLVGAEFVTDANKNEFGLEKIGDFLPPGTGTFNENLQKLMVQFIYREQVELRKKGLLQNE